MMMAPIMWWLTPLRQRFRIRCSDESWSSLQRLPVQTMSHSRKSKAQGISASSFFDLKAELSKQQADFAKVKASGVDTTIVGGVKRPGKVCWHLLLWKFRADVNGIPTHQKPTIWARQNKGVNARAHRDVELEEVAKPTLDSARAALERKAKIYEKLRKGKTGGLSDNQYDALLVDVSDEWPFVSL